MRGALLAAALAIGCTSCDGASAASSPSAPSSPATSAAAPTAWIAAETSPGASRIVVVSASGVRSISDGVLDAAYPSLRHDAARVMFVGRESAGAPRVVFDAAADGSDRRVAVRTDGDISGADWLPDGRIVVSCAVVGGRSLFVAKGDGSAPERISWGLDDADPSVISDGRIVFSAARPQDGDVRRVICTIHPDGTGLAPFHTAASRAARPRQLASLDVEVLDGDARVVVSWDVPSQRVADAPAAPTLPASAPAGAMWHDITPIVARTRPQGHLSSVKPALKSGTLVSVDARSGGRGAAVRFVGAGAPLGPVPLEADGSFSVRLPANAPWRTEILDAAGAVVAAESGPMWVRPGETRLCVGCHDDVETGPPNRRPLALRKDPVDLAGGVR